MVITKVFGITNGGFVTTLAFLALPISSISSFILVYFDVFPTDIYIVGAVLTFLNLCILYTFDDSEWLRKPEDTKEVKEYEQLNESSGPGESRDEIRYNEINTK